VEMDVGKYVAILFQESQEKRHYTFSLLIYNHKNIYTVMHTVVKLHTFNSNNALNMPK
jgi:hypothetical protein